ncbi:hypothetical protein [Sorangium sp. So ce145]|uniref:hypothetical protein n=1 Tax=Sorangium sp. So ce145 TaxID=3133285 RepID=UPI003F5F5F4C
MVKRLRQSGAALLEVADLDERRPQLERALELADHVVDDADEVLLEEIGLEPVKGLLEGHGEAAQGVGALVIHRRGCSAQHPRMERGDPPEDPVAILRGHLAAVVVVGRDVRDAPASPRRCHRCGLYAGQLRPEEILTWRGLHCCHRRLAGIHGAQHEIAVRLSLHALQGAC